MNTSLQNDNSTSSPLPYSEHLVPHGDFTIYARHYAGTGPAFVLMYGFPHGMRNETIELNRKRRNWRKIEGMCLMRRKEAAFRPHGPDTRTRAHSDKQAEGLSQK